MKKNKIHVIDIVYNYAFLQIVDDLISKKDQCKFFDWAFGENFLKSTNYFTTSFDKWNEKHSDIFEVKPSGCAVPDIVKMIRCWNFFYKIKEEI